MEKAIILISTLNFVCLLVLFLVHAQLTKRLITDMTANLNDLQDGYSKMLQTALIHYGSRSVNQAVDMQAILEREQADLEQAATAMEEELQISKSLPGKPKGFIAADGKTYAFTHVMTDSVISKIPKDRLVY